MSSRDLAGVIVLGLLLTTAAAPAGAQLRPLDPLEWRMFDATRTVAFELGTATYWNQRASRAGTEGTLIEAGRARALWRTGGVLFEVAGTVQRFFREERRHDAPGADVRPARNGWRHDSGDYVVMTAVRLTRRNAPLLGVVRFGTRLPTTDNHEGLERDRMDFFALAGASTRTGALLIGAEAGVSINGTRDQAFEQKDVLSYAVRAEYDAGAVTPSLAFTGDVLGPSRQLRGNEPLGEVRLGLQTSGRHWLRAEGIAGYRTFSPRLGIGLSAGVAW